MKRTCHRLMKVMRPIVRMRRRKRINRVEVEKEVKKNVQNNKKNRVAM